MAEAIANALGNILDRGVNIFLWFIEGGWKPVLIIAIFAFVIIKLIIWIKNNLIT